MLKIRGDVKTEYTMTDNICINFPPHDICINNVYDFESKLCIFYCHNKKRYLK